MTHLQKIRSLSYLKWGSLDFSGINPVRSSKTALWPSGFNHIAQGFRFYAIENSIQPENDCQTKSNNPIDELEPFFENIIVPQDTPIPPHNSMLRNSTILGNCHALCKYGIAPTSIARIYKQAKEVFEYDYGVMESNLQRLEQIGLEKSSVIKLVSSSPSLLIGDKTRELCRVIEKLKSIGIESGWLEGHILEGCNYKWSHLLDLLSLLSKIGCSDKQVERIVRRSSAIRTEASVNGGFSLISFLLKFGFNMHDVGSTFLQLPQAKVTRFLYNLRNRYEYLVHIEMDVLDIGRVVRSHPLLLGSCSLKKASSLFAHLQTGKKKVGEVVEENPDMLEEWALESKVKHLPDRREELRSLKTKTQFFLDLGFVENSNEMQKALKGFRGKGAELQERFDSFVKAGLDSEDALLIIKKNPQVLNQSMGMIKKKIDYLINVLGYPLSTLMVFPGYLCYTTERVKLRNAMYVWLKDHGLAEPNLSLSTVVTISDRVFVKNYVNRHPEGPQAWEELKKQIYGACLEPSKTISASLPNTEAQAALKEYLYCTQSLQFSVAESLSLNAPIFLEKLMKESKIETEVKQSVTRFLRYHPINEFEPFFESIGVPLSEYSAFLPRKMMFLNDDPMLLENYNALCNYGFEQEHIGKIYKQAKEVFEYDYGVLQSKLQQLKKIGLQQSAVVKVVSSSPNLLIGDKSGDFCKVVETLKSIGIESGWIGRHILAGCSYNWSRVLELLCLLTKMGCSDEQVAEIIRQSPAILAETSVNAGFSLIGYLLKFGSKIDDICSPFYQLPQVQIGKFLCNLRSCYEFLVFIKMEALQIGKIHRSHSLLLGSCSLKKPNSLRAIVKTGKKQVCKLIEENPDILKEWVLGSNIKPLEDNRSRMKTEFLLNLGFVENSTEMQKALKVFRGGELQERFDTFVKAGFDRDDVLRMIKRSPQVINQSKDVIKRKIDFLLNVLGYPMSTLVACPSFLCFTIQRVKLRHAMYDWLKHHGHAELDLSLNIIVSSSDEAFVKKYVNRHPDGPQAWEELKKQIDDNKYL